jgi:small subunit ribosomal protein S9
MKKATTIKSKAATSKASSAKSVPPIGHGVGRRKSAVARVWIRPGSGKIKVNGKDYTIYFDTEITRLSASQTNRIVPVSSTMDVEASIAGGGRCGQADALKLGIARALLSHDETLRPTLRQNGLITVDSRRKERKKYGQKAARRKFQFVKR